MSWLCEVSNHLEVLEREYGAVVYRQRFLQHQSQTPFTVKLAIALLYRIRLINPPLVNFWSQCRTSLSATIRRAA